MLSRISSWFSYGLTDVSSDYFEVVTPLGTSNVLEPSSSNHVRNNKNTRQYEFITLKDAVDNLSKSSESHLNEKKFLDKNDKETQSFFDKIENEIANHIPRSSIGYIKLRGRKDKSFTAWLLLKENSKQFRIDELFLEKAKNIIPKVTAVTLLNSEVEERGLRISLDENKVRLYEIINGSYKIQFNWKVDHKKFNITARIMSSGTVICDCPSKNLTLKDIKDNTTVKIRMGNVKNKEITLEELILLSKPPCNVLGESEEPES